MHPHLPAVKRFKSIDLWWVFIFMKQRNDIHSFVHSSPFVMSTTLTYFFISHVFFHASLNALFSLYHTHSNLSCWIYTLETLLFSTTIFVEEGKKTCVPCVYDGVNNNNKRKTLGTQTTRVKTKANPTTTPSSPPSYLSIQTNTLTNSWMKEEMPRKRECAGWHKTIYSENQILFILLY